MNYTTVPDEQVRRRVIINRLLFGGTSHSGIQQPARLDQPSLSAQPQSVASPASAALNLADLPEQHDADISPSTQVNDEEEGTGVNLHTNDDDDAPQEAQQDIPLLLAIPSIDIPPHMRVQSPAQLQFPLYEYQKVCLTWLIQQEQDDEKMGSILADGMGLGKTIEALSLILARPSQDENRKTTLVVAPLALLRQWKREIETKVKPGFTLTTLVFHGPPSRYLTINDLLKYDIVLCTYGKLSAEYKVAFEQKRMHQSTILHNRAKFHRVILDEAHNIKNKMAKVSLAAAEIQATYRLCMTGTPFMNRAGELYPLIRFLRILPYAKWENFSEAIDRPIQHWDGDMKANAMQKLQNLFRSITIRRTKDSILDNMPILQLPPRREVDAHTVFDDDQLAFYKALEHKQRLKFNKYLKAGTVMQNYLYCLVLLLRLRQVCDHPHLIKNHSIPEGTKLSASEMLTLALQLEDDVVERLMRQKEFKCPLCPNADATENAVIISPCGHHMCPECYNTSMTVRQTESDGTDFAKITCPADGCEVEILPDNIIMYNFFVDVHMPGSDGDDSAGDGDESSERNADDRTGESSPAPMEYANNEEEMEPENIDMGGFVEAEDLLEDDPRGVNYSNMPGDESTAACRTSKQPEYSENEDDFSSGSSRSETPPWRGNYNELFVTQSPERRPTPETHDLNAEDAILNNNEQQVEANKDFEADGEIVRDHQQDGRMVSELVAARPASERYPSESPIAHKLTSRVSKVERSVTPFFPPSHNHLTGEGTAENPFKIDEEEEEELQMLSNDDKDHRRAQSIHQQRRTDAMNIETYDGPNSPRVDEPWRKREASLGGSANANKKARTHDFLGDFASTSYRASVAMTQGYNYVYPNERAVAAADAEGAHYYLDDPVDLMPDYEGDGGNDDEEDYERQQIYQRDQLDPNTPIPSIEADRNVADPRRKQKKQGAFVSLGDLRNNATKSAVAMHRYRRRLRREWVPSAKTDKIMELLRSFRRRDPREKTLVFSLWTSFLDVLEVPIEDDGGFAHTRYDGGMRPDHRDAAVRRFMDSPGCRVMLVSLTAGNAGLNLTAASNVIICEPFWNPFVEDQAVDRAHRIGQTKEVTVYRVLVAGTVEDRILDLQAKKRALVSAALSEEGASAASQLTVQQLRGLFGF